jgi:hypothetical protein
MKSASAVIFATAVAAEYGYAPASTSSQAGYTTVYPGHGAAPVTVTAQYQPVPTYVNGKWEQYEAISTVITDVYGNKISVTAADENLTVYSTKKTITHTVTAPVEGYAKPTGYYGASNATYTTKTWEELYEEIHEASYDHVGPHGIPGYAGNPKCKDNKDEQGVTVKKYADGKWSTYAQTFTYGAPKPAVTTYDAPGVYTVPASDITVAHPTTVAVEQTYHAAANVPVTYGGITTSVSKPTTITAAYAACETHGAVTKTVIHSKVVTITKAGNYEIVKPTTTVYPSSTDVAYPAVTEYPAGVYHHAAETVTITKPHQAYTCSFEQKSAYAVPTAVSAAVSEYAVPSPVAEKSTGTQPPAADPSSDYEEPAESYGHASAGYVKRGGVIQRRKAVKVAVKAAAHVVLV